MAGVLNNILTKIVGSKNDRDVRRLQANMVERINALEPQIQPLDDEQLRGQDRGVPGTRLESGRNRRRPPARGVCRGAGDRKLASPQDAPLRRPAHGRRGPAPGQDRRDEDRRGQDPGGDAAGLSERPDRQGRARHHRQRLPGPPRQRVDGQVYKALGLTVGLIQHDLTDERRGRRPTPAT